MESKTCSESNALSQSLKILQYPHYHRKELLMRIIHTPKNRMLNICMQIFSKKY